VGRCQRQPLAASSLVFAFALLGLCLTPLVNGAATEEMGAPASHLANSDVATMITLSLPDVEAAPRALFRYSLMAPTAGMGHRETVVNMFATEAGRERLPSWLQLDTHSATLEGVPDVSDIGEYYLNITAVVAIMSPQVVHADLTVAAAAFAAAPARRTERTITDIFLVTVVAPRPSAAAPQRGSVNECLAFRLQLAVNISWQDLSPMHKAAVLADVAQAGGQAPSAWQLVSSEAVGRSRFSNRECCCGLCPRN